MGSEVPSETGECVWFMASGPLKNSWLLGEPNAEGVQKIELKYNNINRVIY
jgi:hypothetical protein